MKWALFISLIFLSSCFNTKPEKLVIDKNTVDYLTIQKRIDTVSLRLSDKQFEHFFSRLDNSISLNPRKGLAEYYFTIHFKDGTTLTYTTHNDIMSGNGGSTYSIGDASYFKNIWFKQAGLTEHHYEYFPTYKNEGTYTQVIETLDSLNLERIKHVLTDDGRTWVDIRGTLFYEGYLSEEQLANYTAKARSK